MCDRHSWTDDERLCVSLGCREEIATQQSFDAPDRGSGRGDDVMIMTIRSHAHRRSRGD